MGQAYHCASQNIIKGRSMTVELVTEKDIKHHVLNESDFSNHGHSELWLSTQERHTSNDVKVVCKQRSAWPTNRFTGFIYSTNRERLLPEA